MEHQFRLRRVLIVSLVVGLLLVTYGVARGNCSRLQQLSRNGTQLQRPCTCPRLDPGMDPTHQIQQGQDVIWQIPADPKAVLFIAHGGGMEALSFFDQGPKCQRCYGLPENRAVVLEALRQRYAVIVVKSIGKAFRAWPVNSSPDLKLVTSVIKSWRSQQSLESLPLVAWGHSAGGFFVTSLTLELPIEALVLMCSSGQHQVLEKASPFHFPPTFFAYMPTDELTLGITRTVTRAMGILTDRGVEVADRQCWPRPLTPLFFTERISCMSNETSEKVYGAYQAEGWLDSNGFLTKSPRTDPWENVLWKWLGDDYLCFELDVGQELKMAYAEHSFTSAANQEIFSWLNARVLMWDGHSMTSPAQWLK